MQIALRFASRKMPSCYSEAELQTKLYSICPNVPSPSVVSGSVELRVIEYITGNSVRMPYRILAIGNSLNHAMDTFLKVACAREVRFVAHWPVCTESTR